MKCADYAAKCLGEKIRGAGGVGVRYKGTRKEKRRYKERKVQIERKCKEK